MTVFTYHKVPREIYRGPVVTKYARYDEAVLYESSYRSAHQIRALMLTDIHQQPILTCTVNLEDYGMIPGNNTVIIKDYSANEGVLDWLEKIGCVKRLLEVPCGYENAWVCEYLMGEIDLSIKVEEPEEEEPDED